MNYYGLGAVIRDPRPAQVEQFGGFLSAGTTAPQAGENPGLQWFNEKVKRVPSMWCASRSVQKVTIPQRTQNIPDGIAGKCLPLEDAGRFCVLGGTTAIALTFVCLFRPRHHVCSWTGSGRWFRGRGHRHRTFSHHSFLQPPRARSHPLLHLLPRLQGAHDRTGREAAGTQRSSSSGKRPWTLGQLRQYVYSATKLCWVVRRSTDVFPCLQPFSRPYTRGLSNSTPSSSYGLDRNWWCSWSTLATPKSSSRATSTSTNPRSTGSSNPGWAMGFSFPRVWNAFLPGKIISLCWAVYTNVNVKRKKNRSVWKAL